jgi:polyisoprenoid-binding protein YceI
MEMHAQANEREEAMPALDQQLDQQIDRQITPGTWSADQVHSRVGFAVRHMVVATFRGDFTDFRATLTVGEDGEPRLEGAVLVTSVDVRDDNLRGHLLSPEFFDAERHPEIRFASTSWRVDGDGHVAIEGDLTIKGRTERVAASGSLARVEADIAGNERLGLELETVIDRRRFGLDWNAPLPRGGVAVDNDVTLSVALELTAEA